jgi:hypothetical protein
MNLSVLRYLSRGGLLPAVVLAAGVASAAPPNVLGVSTGMSASDTYNAVKAADVQHRVALEQMAIPQLLGEKTAVYKMGPDTADPLNVFYVNLTLPPSPQVVWQVYHQLGQLHVTQEQALASLTNKYGAKYRSRLPVSPTGGTLHWIYDEQGNLSDMPFSQEAKCLQTNGLMNPFGAQSAGAVAPGTRVRFTQPTGQVRQIPPVFNPATLPECQHLVWVEATVQGIGLTWTITVTITDWDLEHRSSIASINFLNALATKQQKKELDQAEHTAVPTL